MPQKKRKLEVSDGPDRFALATAFLNESPISSANHDIAFMLVFSDGQTHSVSVTVGSIRHLHCDGDQFEITGWVRADSSKVFVQGSPEISIKFSFKTRTGEAETDATAMIGLD